MVLKSRLRFGQKSRLGLRLGCESHRNPEGRPRGQRMGRPLFHFAFRSRPKHSFCNSQMLSCETRIFLRKIPYSGKRILAIHGRLGGQHSKRTTTFHSSDLASLVQNDGLEVFASSWKICATGNPSEPLNNRQYFGLDAALEGVRVKPQDQEAW
jgi:hypothetical protein